MPLVLFSSPECRAIAVDLQAGDTMGDHQVRERAVVQVVTGRVTVEASGEKAECDAGTLITFEPRALVRMQRMALVRLERDPREPGLDRPAQHDEKTPDRDVAPVRIG